MQKNIAVDQPALPRRKIQLGDQRPPVRHTRMHPNSNIPKPCREMVSKKFETRDQEVEILTAVDAEASLARREGRTVAQESMRQPAAEVKQRGRSRFAAEHINDALN
jgi:hypothetical protein